MIYDWKYNMPVNAQDAGEYLEILERKNGNITPKLVVDNSRSEKSVLHKCFEWNDNLAAEKYRENQAGFILRNLVTVAVNKQEQSEIRAFVSVFKDDNNCFVSVNTAMSDQTMREQVLQKALAEMISFKKKYSQIKELAVVFEAIDSLGA